MSMNYLLQIIKYYYNNIMSSSLIFQFDSFASISTNYMENKQYVC
jgi:hypothetical protein